MKALDDGQGPTEVAARARRAKRIILCVMAALILLSFIIPWLTGSVAF